MYILLYLIALHSHNSEALPGPAGQVVGLVPRVAMPMSPHPVNKRDLQHQLQVEAGQNHDDMNNFKLEDLPDEGMYLSLSFSFSLSLSLSPLPPLSPPPLSLINYMYVHVLHTMYMTCMNKIIMKKNQTML